MGDLGLGTYVGEDRGKAHSKVMLTALSKDKGMHTPLSRAAFLSPIKGTITVCMTDNKISDHHGLSATSYDGSNQNVLLYLSHANCAED